LVRFRTGDIITLTGTGKAICGRTAPRFRVIGRTDDMVVVRGINVFPSQIAPILNREPGLSGEYRIVLPSTKPYDVLPLEAEIGKLHMFGADLADRIAANIKRDLGVTAHVRLIAYGTLRRNEGKTRRVVQSDAGLTQ
jgi:phenylacetate-CoA ligase